MACTNCLDNCSPTISDKCTEYTGDEIPLLGICPGDSLSKVESIIIDKLLSALDGTGIKPINVTLDNCAWLKQQFIGKDPILANFLQLLIDNECTLKAAIDQINATIGSTTNFNTTCIANVPVNASPNQVLQAFINDYCSTKDIVTSIPNTYVKLTDLTTLVTEILTTLGLIGGSSVIQYAQYLPPKVVMPYFGSMAVFDGSGIGLASAGFSGIYHCNGLNGTPDCRGRGIVGAVKNVPGGTLDSAVDPTLPINPLTNYAVLDKFGENYHKLITSEIPPHTHSIVDPGHTHALGSGVVAIFTGTNTGISGGGFNGASTQLNQTNSATTGITIGSTGGGLIHENRQPSIVANWIIRL